MLQWLVVNSHNQSKRVLSFILLVFRQSACWLGKRIDRIIEGQKLCPKSIKKIIEEKGFAYFALLMVAFCRCPIVKNCLGIGQHLLLQN